MAVKDDSGAIKGWRPPGGAIEFGETAEDALKREFLEEFGESIGGVSRICVLENLYAHEGEHGHEIVFVFAAEFENSSAYSRNYQSLDDGGLVNEMLWIRSQDFKDRAERLFPDELVQHLR